jgi:hypothetical protein
MAEFDLISAVQPSEGWFVVVGLRNGLKDIKQVFVATREEVDTQAVAWVAQKRNVFFGLAKYSTDTNRTKDNVKTLKAFWLDIDCGKDKAKEDPVTGRPKGYIDQATGLRALREFCTLLGLPKPIIVDSGRGLHVYWALETEISRAEWEPVGLRLRDLCKLHNFYVDPAIFEVARILRIPGTLNFKADPPAPVVVMSTAGPVTFEKFRNLLGADDLPEAPPRVKRELSALGKSMLGNVESSFKKIMIRSAKGTGCQQLLSCFQDRATLDEPRWFDALSIAKFCSDRDTAIHKLSEGHPDYDHAVVEKKVQGIKGPHSCAEFEAKNPGGCEGCPHWGKITNPLALGKDIVRATKADNTVEVAVETVTGEVEVKTHEIPEYPFPFFRGKAGGVYMRAEEDEEEPKLVCVHDLYVLKLMHDPIEKFVAVLRVHLPKDGVIEFVIPNTSITDRGELRKALSAVGVLGGEAKFSLLGTYIMASINELQQRQKAELMRLQFGWVDKDTKFIAGNREISRDGVYHSPPSSVTRTMTHLFEPKGTLDKWKEVFKLYGRPGLEVQAFAALSAFGSPLLKFTGQKGAIINLIHGKSGTGKTTVLRMANSVFGYPEGLLGTPDDTKVGRIIKVGILNNIVNTIDELTNITGEEISQLLYAYSQGRGKDKAKNNANELRENNVTWRTITLSSGNASLSQKLTVLKNSPEGELMRLMEFKIVPPSSAIVSVEEGKDLFDHALNENYGHAGDVYMRWVLSNLDEVIATVLRVQKAVDVELNLTQRERNFSAMVASNIVGGLIAKKIGLIDWDINRIRNVISPLIRQMGRDSVAPAADASGVLGDYMYRHNHNILVVDEGVDKRSNMHKLPTQEPRGALLIRYEPDTKRVFISVREFKKDCADNQIDYKDLLQELTTSGALIEIANKRMAKGSKIIAPGVRALVLDSAHKDFYLDMNNMVGLPAAQDED